MLRHARLFVFALLSIFVLAQCRSASKMVESGAYDDAIAFSVNKLKGKKNKKSEYVKALEIAFQKATERDMRLAESLKSQNRPENWEKIHRIHEQIGRRQALVYPLIPLQSKDGYEAKFMFVNIEKLEAESREKAAEYLYQSAQKDIQLARNGDKQAARNAYQSLVDLERKYFSTYENKEQLKREARQLGTVHIRIDLDNRTHQVLPRDFFERLTAINQSDLDTEWRNFHFKSEPGVTDDYIAVIQLDRIDISPERIVERQYTDEKTIQDGWEYERDARGNIKRDSTGKEIKHPRMVRVRADVVEVAQSKATRIQAYLNILDNHPARRRVESVPLSTEIIFEHFAATFRGDQRALSDVTKSRIGSAPAPFPSDLDMLTQAAERLKPVIAEELRCSEALKF